MFKIADIKGISPLVCTHQIFLEEDAKPVRQAQRRLNLTTKEVVQKEVLKLWDACIIYPISDSKWESPTQVVPKKLGIIVASRLSKLLTFLHFVLPYRYD